MQSDALNPNPSRFLRSGFFFSVDRHRALLARGSSPSSAGKNLQSAPSGLGLWLLARGSPPPPGDKNSLAPPRRQPAQLFASCREDRRQLRANTNTSPASHDFLYFGPCFNFFCPEPKISFLPSDPLVTVKNWSGSRGSRSSNRKRKKTKNAFFPSEKSKQLFQPIFLSFLGLVLKIRLCFFFSVQISSPALSHFLGPKIATIFRQTLEASLRHSHLSWPGDRHQLPPVPIKGKTLNNKDLSSVLL